MRKITILERIVLFVAPMRIKYKVFQRIYDEGHASSIGIGESPGLFGFFVTSDISLQWKDRTRKSIHINRQPVWEIVLLVLWFYWATKILYNSISFIQRIVEIKVTIQ